MEDYQIEPESFLMLIGVPCCCCNTTNWDGKHNEHCLISKITSYIAKREAQPQDSADVCICTGHRCYEDGICKSCGKPILR
jgi:hypothetical protein